jgi:drug/metabolite transporter (DMT)-like permease
MRVPKGQWARLTAIALVNMAGWNIFVVHGMRLMESGRAAIIGYTMPVWGVILSTWLLKEPFTVRRFVGVALGLGGMVLLLSNELRAVGDAPLGTILVTAAAVFWALGTVMMKKWPVDLPATSFTAWQMVIAVVPALAIALAREPGPFSPFALHVWPMLGVFYNIVVSFVLCYWAWTRIALIAPVGVSSLAVMMTPVVGVFSSMVLLGEQPHWYDYAALCLVVASLCTVLIPPRQAKLPAQA